LEDKKIHKSFLKFVPVTDRSGCSLAQTIIDELTKLKLDLNYLRGVANLMVFKLVSERNTKMHYMFIVVHII